MKNVKSKNLTENRNTINLNFLNKIKSALSDPIYSRFEKTKKKSQKENINSKKKLDLKIKQLSLSKIAVNIHNLDPQLLINSHMDLAELYSSLIYSQQSFEHYRQALKTHNIYYKKKEELRLKFKIFSKLIESSYFLKSYNQTLSYIQNYYNLLSKFEIEDISSLLIELIHAKTLYALNDFEKSEKQFLRALNMLNKEIDLLVKLNCENFDFDRNNFIFEHKTRILDFLYKIKIKEDDLKREQLELINQILELCQKGETENIKNKELLFQMKSKYVLKKIDLIDEESKNNDNLDQLKKENNQDFNMYRKNIFLKYTKYLTKVFSTQNLIHKNNSKILKKILVLFKRSISQNILDKKFIESLELIKIIQILDNFFFGEFSKNISKNNYIEAFLILILNQENDFTYAESLLKKVLKISRHFKMEKLYRNAKECLKCVKNKILPVFDEGILANY